MRPLLELIYAFVITTLSFCLSFPKGICVCTLYTAGADLQNKLNFLGISMPRCS
jgi:hypothetical protein